MSEAKRLGSAGFGGKAYWSITERCPACDRPFVIPALAPLRSKKPPESGYVVKHIDRFKHELVVVR